MFPCTSFPCVIEFSRSFTTMYLQEVNIVKHVIESWWAFTKLHKLRSHWIVLHVSRFVSGRLQCWAQINVISQSWMIAETMCCLENLMMGALHWVKVVQSPLDNWCDSSEQSTLCVMYSDMQWTPLVTQQSHDCLMPLQKASELSSLRRPFSSKGNTTLMISLA